MSIVDIIIPSFNNDADLGPCIRSILKHRGTADLFRIILVNNGEPRRVEGMTHKDLTIVQMKDNLGWEGGLKAGLAVSTAPYVVFMNDDTLVPPSQSFWVNRLLEHFADPLCAAAGPSSNFVSGPASIFFDTDAPIFRVPFLIGFCMMVRRADLDACGGVDDTTGADDIDLSIRLRKMGKHLIVDKNVFIFHHGAKTGMVVHGNNARTGWYGAESIDKRNHAIIRKHGLKEFVETYMGTPVLNYHIPFWGEGDVEGEAVRAQIVGAKVLELGCGAKKTIEGAFGIDIVAKGEMIPGLDGERSLADAVGDVSEPLPVEKGSFDTCIARHLLEHMIDPVKAIKNWGDAIKDGGRLVIAVPDQGLFNTIPLNHQHVHAYTVESLRNFMRSLGWKALSVEPAKNNMSIVGTFEKNGVHYGCD